jgi:hypothetical protein
MPNDGEGKMEINDDVLQMHAVEATKRARQVAETREAHYWEFMGYVGAALQTDQGNTYTGIYVSLPLRNRILCGTQCSSGNGQKRRDEDKKDRGHYRRRKCFASMRKVPRNDVSD